MRIAILTPTFSHFSGIDRLVEIQSRKFIERGDKVDIFALHATIKPKKCGLYVIGMPKSPTFQRIYRLMMFLDIKKIKKYADIVSRYDMVISHFYPMNLIAYDAKKKNPALKYQYNNAGVGIVDTYSFSERLYLRMFNWLNNLTIRNCDSAVSISKFLRDILKKETGIDSKVEYVEIDKKRFHKGIDGRKIRQKYRIQDEPVLLYIGRVSPHKGVHLLIESFALVKEKYPDTKLIIVGKHTFPKYSRKLKKIGKEGIIFTGFVSDKEIPFYYSACDIYTTASLWEGFDMPIAEAYEVGKPSVAFDIGSHAEVLKKGKLIKKVDTSQFSKGIIELIKKTKERK